MFFYPPYGIAIGGTGATTKAGAQTNLGIADSSTVMLLNGTQSMTAALNMGSQLLNNVAPGVAGTDGVNVNQLNALASGVNQRFEARVASVGANITTAGSAPNTLDGITLQLNDYVLLKDQTSQPTNGLYTVTTLGTGSNGTWTRATQMNTSSQLTPGMYFFIGQGSVNAGSTFMLQTDEPYTLGTTNLVFVQTNGAFDITAGNGLTKSGNALSILLNGSTLSVSGSGIQISATYAGQTTIVNLGVVTTGTWNATTIGVPYGGTGATSASGARSNLASAPNTPSYWLGAANGELGNGIIPSVGSGLTLTPTTGVFGIDTAVVVTASNSITMTNKTLTAPTITFGFVTAQTGSYSGLLSDGSKTVPFNITAASNYTLPLGSGLPTGWWTCVKNKKASTANVTLFTTSPNTGENSTFTSSTGWPFPITPGSAVYIEWDGTEFMIT